MAWIESHQELARHPKTRKAARALGISRAAMIGHLQCLWWWALDFAEDGNLSKFAPDDIAEEALWEGDPDRFIAALLDCGDGDGAGFMERIDGQLQIHDWWEYAGKLIERRRKDRDRKREERAKAVLGTSTGHTSDVRVLQKTVQKTEDRTETEPRGSSPPKGAAPPRVRDLRPRQKLWAALRDGLGWGPETENERGKWNKAIALLEGADNPVTPEEVPTLIGAYGEHYGGTTCTPTAIANNLSTLRNVAPPNKSNGLARAGPSSPDHVSEQLTINHRAVDALRKERTL